MKEWFLNLLKVEFVTTHLLPAIGTAAATYFLGRWTRLLAQRLFRRMDDVDRSVEKVIGTCLAWAVYTAGIVATLSFLGVNTTGLLAALSAMGLAIGIALKDTLGNVAAGLQLLFLRPIRTGDYVQCGSVAGTVQDIGLFSTLLKTFDGLFVSAPNSLLCNAPLTNYTMNSTRRIDIPVSISYRDSIDTGLRVLMKCAADEPRLLQDPEPRAFVSKLDDSGVVLTLRVWVPREVYFDVLFDATRAIKLAIEKAGLTIPFPQRDVHLDAPPPGPPSRA